MTAWAVIALWLLAQNPVPERRQAPAPGLIQGVVVRAGSGLPLSKAEVELFGAGLTAPALSRVITEDDGRFVLQDVPPGRYRLAATRAGYIRAPLTITLAAGQKLSDLRLSMAQTGAIFGRLLDENGEPVSSAEVRALKATYQEGARILTVMQSARTNDRGEYRLFWLPPGRYHVSAVYPDTHPAFGGTRMMTRGATGLFVGRSTSDSTLPPVRPFDMTSSHVPVYFPGTFDESAASALDVRSGADTGDVNFVVARAGARRVRGTIVNGPTGQPSEYGHLKEAQGPLASFVPDLDVDPRSGSFDISLAPGPHTLVATGGNGIGYALVVVGDTDIDGLTIATWPAFDIPGRIVVEGRSGDNPDLASLRISLRRDPPIPGTSPTTYSVPFPNGSFTLHASPGDFRLNIAPVLNLTPAPPNVNMPAGLADVYVKSIRLGSADVLNGDVRLAGPSNEGLEIVLGRPLASVEGRVVNEQQEGVDAASVALVPNERRRHELYFSVTSDAAGRFRFDRVPPGDYKAFAWTEVETLAWNDPDFMRTHEDRGTAVRVGEGASETVTLIALSPQP